jgi:hypothetical protein
VQTPRIGPWARMAAVLVVAASSGCATFINDPTHPMRIDTATEDGRLIEGADCTLTNPLGTLKARSGETSLVPRSNSDMDIVCRLPGQPDASARVVSRANVGLAGNLFFGGGVGALIDHSKSTAYSYPTWIRLVFGQTRLMDRREEVDGKPLLGRPSGTPAS